MVDHISLKMRETLLTILAVLLIYPSKPQVPLLSIYVCFCSWRVQAEKQEKASESYGESEVFRSIRVRILLCLVNLVCKLFCYFSYPIKNGSCRTHCLCWSIHQFKGRESKKSSHLVPRSYVPVLLTISCCPSKITFIAYAIPSYAVCQ